MAHVDLVPALLVDNDLVVVKDLEEVVLHQAGVSEVLAAFHQLDVDGCARVVAGRDENFFLEDYSVLGGSVLVRVLDRLAADDLGELECFLVRVDIDFERALLRVVGHVALDDEHVASLVGG